MKRWLIMLIVCLSLVSIVGLFWSYTSFLRIPENKWSLSGTEQKFQEDCWQPVHSGFEVEQRDHTLQFFGDGRVFDNHWLWDVAENARRWSFADIHGKWWTMRYSQADQRWYKKVLNIYCVKYK